MTEPLTVVISTDGTAEIDGVPVPVVPGESLDVAILDTLHGYARGRDAPVTAAITDPDAGHVALVEVAPDGSSTLLEQVPSTDTAPATPATPATPAPAPVPEAPPRRKTVPQSDDEYQAPGLLQRPLVLGTVGVTVAVLVIGSLVALGTHGPTDGDSQTTGADQPSVSLEPSTPPTPVTVTPTLSSRAYTPPPPTPKHKSEPEPDKSRKRQPKAPATPTPAATPEPTPTPTADPTPPTAALAVSKLAAREPGRHICYRAFVEGTGWQRPVCDGATAGVVKGEKKIRSLNFAVSGTKGTSANAYRHEKGWWQTPWPGVVDGVDLYVHTTKKDAPYLLGFAVNVGEGVVCANANVQTQGWHGLKCDEPGGYVFGGTLDEDLWLRAVRFTV